MTKTSEQFEYEIEKCRQVFAMKAKDYGTSWRILRLPSLTDQIFIKANRIRSIQMTGVNQIEEGIVPEFIAMVNYSVIALIQIELGLDGEQDLPFEKAMELYNKHIIEPRLRRSMETNEGKFDGGHYTNETKENKTNRRQRRQNIDFGRCGRKLYRYNKLFDILVDTT